MGAGSSGGNPATSSATYGTLDSSGNLSGLTTITATGPISGSGVATVPTSPPLSQGQGYGTIMVQNSTMTSVTQYLLACWNYTSEVVQASVATDSSQSTLPMTLLGAASFSDMQDIGTLNCEQLMSVGNNYSQCGLLAPTPVIGNCGHIALSPDGTTLYASVICAITCGAPPPGGCTVVTGICIFNASTLAFESQLAQVAGNLSVSEDGTSLYVTESSRSEYLYIVNTSSLAISRIQVSAHYTIQGPVVVSPAGHYGLVFVGPNAEMSTTAFVLDTSTNTISKPFFGNAPGGASVVPMAFLQTGKPVAFAPNGASVWMVLECYAGSTSCTIPGGTGRAVFGISITSGTIIAETPVPGDAQSIAFPY